MRCEFRRSSVVCLLAVAALGVLAACGRTPRTPHHRTVDWYALDRILDPGVPPFRPGWSGHALTRESWAGPAPTFLPTIAFAASWDSLDTEAFHARPDAERAWRREAAAELVQAAVVAVADRAARIRRGVGGDARYAKVMTRVLRRLHTAVGTDPTSSDAWFHLAVFSEVIGDRDNASRARHRYLRDAGPEPGEPAGARPARRCRLILDEAWDLREQGRFSDCLAWLDVHTPELATGPASEYALTPAAETDLLRALCHAERGEFLPTRIHLARLPQLALKTSSHGAGMGSETTDDLRAWVHAWLDLRTGNLDLATWRLQYRRFGVRPAGIGWRFWQDLGQIAAEVGDVERARQFWQLAFWERPYKLLFPQTGHLPAGAALAEPDADLPYFQAYRTYFFAGSRWSFAVQRALACEQIDPRASPLVWRQALASLETCIRRGFQPRAARVLRARLFLLQGDWRQARTDLEAASLADRKGRFDEVEHALLYGVAALAGGDVATGRQWLERCVELAADHVRAWQALAVALAHERRDAEALAAFDRAARLAPHDGLNYFNRGLLHLQRGDRATAVADLERAAALLRGQTRVADLLRAIAAGTDVTVELTLHPAPVIAATGAGDPGGDPRRTLASAWPAGEPSELERALTGDRDGGDATRALAIAAGEVAPADLDEPSLLLAMTILLDHGHMAAAKALVEFARGSVPAGSPTLELMQRMVR